MKTTKIQLLSENQKVTQNVTQLEFEQFVDQHPTLTTHGIGVEPGADLKLEHGTLKDYFEAFEVCCEMLQKKFQHSTNPKHKEGSYHMKHEAEHFASKELKKDIYVPEGSYVAAAKYLGLPYRRSKTTPGIVMQLRAVK